MNEKRLQFSFLQPECCPYCGSVDFVKNGISHFKQRYRCKRCNRAFVSTTGTFLAQTKKSESKWEDYVIQFTNDATLLASKEYSNLNKNTVHLWRIKLMRCLHSYVEEAVLSGKVWIDEIYFSVGEKELIRKENGRLLTGISRNLIAVEVAIDDCGDTYAKVMGRGKPTSKMVDEALSGHIAQGATVVHDGFHGHQEALKKIGVNQIVIGSQKKSYFKIMQRANQFCALIKRVFVLHVGERASHLQDYLDWCCFRQAIRFIKPAIRKRYVLEYCAKTGVNYQKKR